MDPNYDPANAIDPNWPLMNIYEMPKGRSLWDLCFELPNENQVSP